MLEQFMSEEKGIWVIYYLHCQSNDSCLLLCPKFTILTFTMSYTLACSCLTSASSEIQVYHQIKLPLTFHSVNS